MTEQTGTPAREWTFDLPAPVSLGLDSIEAERPGARQLLVRLALRLLVFLINSLNRTNAPRGELTVGAAFAHFGRGRAE
jgi:hypothetical protein